MATTTSIGIPSSAPAGARATEIYEEISSRYDVTSRLVHIGDYPFRILIVRDTNALLEKIDQAVFAEDERLPYWADLWASAIELARWCAEEASLGEKRVLELGCGLGLCGITAARSGAFVTMTDYEADALLFARYNTLNNIPESHHLSRVDFQLMDWRSPLDLPPFDLVIGSDIVYERRNIDPVLSLLKRMLLPDGHAVFTDPDRGIAREFLASAKDRGFHVQSHTTEVMMHGRSATIVRHHVHLHGLSP